MIFPTVGSSSPPSAVDTAPAARTGARRGPSFPIVPVGAALAAPTHAPAGGDTPLGARPVTQQRPEHGNIGRTPEWRELSNLPPAPPVDQDMDWLGQLRALARRMRRAGYRAWGDEVDRLTTELREGRRS